MFVLFKNKIFNTNESHSFCCIKYIHLLDATVVVVDESEEGEG